MFFRSKEKWEKSAVTAKTKHLPQLQLEEEEEEEEKEEKRPFHKGKGKEVRGKKVKEKNTKKKEEMGKALAMDDEKTPLLTEGEKEVEAEVEEEMIDPLEEKEEERVARFAALDYLPLPVEEVEVKARTFWESMRSYPSLLLLSSPPPLSPPCLM